MSTGRRLYSLRIQVTDCSYDVRVNDCPIVRHWSRHVSGTFPINEWIAGGPNTLAIKIGPRRGEDTISDSSELRLSIDSRNEVDDRTNCVTSIIIQSGKLNTRETADTVRVLREGEDTILAGTFIADVPFGDWKWQSSSKIVDLEAWRKLLLAEYQTLHAAIASQDTASIIDRSSERNVDRGVAYFSSKEEQQSIQRNSYAEVFLTPDMTLAPLQIDSLQLEVFGGGRLSQLIDPLNQACIQVIHKDRQFLAQFPFIFRNNNGPVICR
jgi:hypothetical protein